MPARPAVGVGILIRRGSEVLLVRRRNVHGAGTWSTPGGHLETGETPEDCARREALEETGVTVGDVRFRAMTSDVFEAEGRHYITFWMEAEHAEGDAAVVADYELSEVGWFAWDSLPESLFLSLANLIAGRCYPEERGGLDALRVLPD